MPTRLAVSQNFLPRRKAMNIVCPLDVTLDLTERLKFVDLFIHELIMNM